MFEIYDGDIRYFVHFKHSSITYREFWGKMDGYETKRITTCSIYTGEREKEILIGTGNSAVDEDQFSKLVGRTLSFFRALDSMGLYKPSPSDLGYALIGSTYLLTEHERALRSFLTGEFCKRNSMAEARRICKERGFSLDDYLPKPKTRTKLDMTSLSIYPAPKLRQA